MLRAGLSTCVCSIALLAGSPAPGQAAAPQAAPPPAQGSRTTVYNAAFFAQYAPRTALDIAQRVPGFNLDLGNTDIRGFAAAAGNVVINGARPSNKSEALDQTLSRIPADRVTRVEVGPGDLYGADYSSKSQVLNIILSDAGGIDANVTGSVRRLYTGRLVPDGSASALIRRGASSINLSAGSGNVLNLEEGTDTLTDVATGELVEFRRKHNSYHDINPYLSASWALERASDKAIRINARWAAGKFRLHQDNHVIPTGFPDHDDNLIQDYRNPVFELGGDITRPFAGGAIKFVGLATRRKRNNFDGYIQRDATIAEGGQVNGGFEQTQKAHRNETIGRLSWTRADLAGLSVEAGGEVALNTLDNRTELFEVQPDGSKTKVELPIESAKVKEKRAEPYVNVGKTISPSLRVDGGLTYEYSHLTVTGDAQADRKLQFWKPSLTIDWKPGGKWHTQFSVKRTVAQLDFFDFISVADLSAGRVNGGNENLQPQQAWEFRATAEHPLLGEGLAKLDLGYNVISMLQDRILIFDEETNQFFDAPGNIGTGTQAFATLTLDAPLNRLWKGLRVKFDGTLRRTRVDDPISGRPRKFSGYFPAWEWSFSVRRDSGAWSYGLAASDNQRTTFYRTDEFDTNFNGSSYWTAFVEYRPGPRTSITFDIDNAFNTRAKRDRLLFLPNRAVPALILDEFRERNRHLNLGLTFKQSFGGGGGVAN
ncbi:MAG TPA: outer membrane beta-barrel protein [Sphingomicrobium sp.]|nr:outer membrane beta-barrel protein [Sphingomicrobium sp.]